MSRRRGEFEHRTSIFEGAFRAWSHLGGIEPLDLENKPTTDLDPLNFPLEADPRLASQKGKKKKEGGGGGDINNGGDDGLGGDGGKKDGGVRRDYPYEPLPRSGLAHPFVQAILSPWLGPDADQDAIQLGLTTLRTWWQHRRKGESGSAVVALGTDKMRGVVEGYTRHFFNLAHCLIVNDKEQPPRTLHGKMRDLEKSRNKKGKKRTREDESIKAAAMAFQSGFGPGVSVPNNQKQQGGDPSMLNPMLAGGGGGMPGMDNGNALLSPLERLHQAQRRQLTEQGGVHTNVGGGGQIPDSAAANTQPIEMKGRCMPGKVDLPGLVQQVSSAATQLAHRGMSGNAQGINKMALNNIDPSKYGDPTITPIVLASPNQNTGANDIQFMMTIDGITCAHCVKIVETVLKGCHGSRSPIDGLLDAAADMELHMVLIKIDSMAECRRIAHEAARNLSMVGYTAKAKGATVPGDMTLRDAWTVMDGTIPNVSPMRGFEWGYDCTCPDNNVLRQDCPRHSQMGPGVIEAFDKTERLMFDFINGCIKKTGMPCTAGHHCYCQANDNNNGTALAIKNEQHQQQGQPTNSQSNSNSMYQGQGNNTNNNNNTQQQDTNGAYMSYQQPIQDGAPSNNNSAGEGDNNGNGNGGMPSRRQGRSSMRMSIGRMSIGGLGGLGRQFSLTSETTFGRAMSGLSALSIDWENMDDFDINVDHSAGINNDIINGQQQGQGQKKDQQGQNGNGTPNPAEDNGQGGYGQQQGGEGNMRGPRVARRSSLRKNIPPMNNGGNPQAYNVSFNM